MFPSAPRSRGKHLNIKMSRGPGKLQRTVTRLIEDEPEGAWSIGDLAWIVYGKEPEKKHRVALLRMLKTVTLPGTLAALVR